MSGEPWEPPVGRAVMLSSRQIHSAAEYTADPDVADPEYARGVWDLHAALQAQAPVTMATVFSTARRVLRRERGDARRGVVQYTTVLRGHPLDTWQVTAEDLRAPNFQPMEPMDFADAAGQARSKGRAASRVARRAGRR